MRCTCLHSFLYYLSCSPPPLLPCNHFFSSLFSQHSSYKVAIVFMVATCSQLLSFWKKSAKSPIIHIADVRIQSTIWYDSAILRWTLGNISTGIIFLKGTFLEGPRERCWRVLISLIHYLSVIFICPSFYIFLTSCGHDIPPDHLLLDSAPNLGPLISCWEIYKFENC